MRFLASWNQVKIASSNFLFCLTTKLEKIVSVTSAFPSQSFLTSFSLWELGTSYQVFVLWLEHDSRMMSEGQKGSPAIPLPNSILLPLFCSPFIRDDDFPSCTEWYLKVSGNEKILLRLSSGVEFSGLISVWCNIQKIDQALDL